MSPPEPPGRSTFTIEGRSAPGLFLFGWIGSLLGLGAVIAALLSAGGTAATILFVGGVIVLDLGLIAGAGSQALERRARGKEPYTGPSPLLVLLVAIATVYLAAFVVGLPLDAAGVTLPRPLAELLVVAIQTAVFVAVVRLLVVGTGALSWREMGFVGPARRALAEAAWGMIVAGPVILVTAIVSSLLVSIVHETPASPLPPTGSAAGLLVNLVAGAIVGPIGEETLFRGLATTAWVRSLGARAGIVRAAILFALVHVLLTSADTFGAAAGMAAVGFLGRLPVALVLGWVYVRRGTIWAPLGLHVAFNAVLLIAAETVGSS